MNFYTDVRFCKYPHCSSNLIVEHSQHSGPCVSKDSRSTYYFMDAPGADAFGHWIFETFIFFYMIQELNKAHSNMILLTTNQKMYVKSFLKFFNIPNRCVSKIEEDCNVTFVAPPISLNDISLDISSFSEKVMNFREACRQNLHPYEKNISICLLPRQKTDNYVPNDFLLNVDVLAEEIRTQGGIVMDTFITNDISVQFTTIMRSNVIILNYGSVYLVNGLIAKGSLILVIDTRGDSYQITTYPAIRCLHEIICSQNRVKILPPGTALTWNGILPFID